MSLTEVLPVEPVIPTSGQPISRRQARARVLQRRERVVGAEDPARPARRAVRSAWRRARARRRPRPRRPATSASAAKRPPSTWAPASPKKRSPGRPRAGVDHRALGAAALAAGERSRRRPRRRSVLAASSITTGSGPARSRAQLFAGDVAVVEGDLPAALELLALLVALAGDHDEVAGRTRGRRPRAIAARRSTSTTTRSRSASNARQRPRRRSRAGSSERGLSEVMTATSESSAAARPISGRLSRSRSPPQPRTQISRPSVSSRAAREHVLERVGRVGVVDEDGEGLALVDRLDAAGDRVGVGQRRDRRRRGRAREPAASRESPRARSRR